MATSKLTWLVLALVVVLVYTSNEEQPQTTKDKAPLRSEIVKKDDSPVSSWRTSSENNKMTGKTSFFAYSQDAFPSKEMDFPYHNIHGWLMIGCNAKDWWVSLGFSDAPNLANTQTGDGYNKIETRIKWDKEVNDVSLKQQWGAKFIHFSDDKALISKISASKKMLLELQWHGQQPVYFEYHLDGSSKAIEEIRGKCLSAK